MLRRPGGGARHRPAGPRRRGVRVPRPNGAGKTTTVEILEGYCARDAGQVEVLGIDPAAADRPWRARIGVVLQSGQTQPVLTVQETIEQFAGYYPSPRPVA